MKKAIGVTAALLVIGGVVWAMRGPSVDPEVLRVEAMADQLFNNREGMTDEQRRQAWGDFRQTIEQLPDETRQQLRQRREAQMNKRMEEELTKFFALSPQERTKELDKRIDQMEQWRKRWEQERNRPQVANRDRGGERGGRDGNRSAGGDRGRDGGGRERWSNMSGADRNQRRQEYLSRTTATQRGMRDEYSRQMRERRQQRGLPPGRGGRWG
jgi:hypothetical protein